LWGARLFTFIQFGPERNPDFCVSGTNPQLAAVLIEKAADLKSQVDETSTTPDPSPLAPDVEPPA
jgi:hypothetical protein